LSKNPNNKIIGKISGNYNNNNNNNNYNYNYNNYNEIQNKYINSNITNISPQNKSSKKFSTATVIKITDSDNDDKDNHIQTFDNNINLNNNNINNNLVNENIGIQTDLNDLNNISNIPYNRDINNYDYEKSIKKEKIDSNANNEIIESDNFQLLRENDVNNNLNKTDFNNNEINKEISLDYSNISKEEPKDEEYKKSNENSFSINKTKRINKKKVKVDKSPNTNRRKKSKLNVKKKDTSTDKKKARYNFQIDLKDLIKADIIEKSLLSPSKRYKNQTNKDKKKTKKETVQYNQPFKFNLYEDFWIYSYLLALNFNFNFIINIFMEN